MFPHLCSDARACVWRATSWRADGTANQGHVILTALSTLCTLYSRLAVTAGSLAHARARALCLSVSHTRAHKSERILCQQSLPSFAYSAMFKTALVKSCRAVHTSRREQLGFVQFGCCVPKQLSLTVGSNCFADYAMIEEHLAQWKTFLFFFSLSYIKKNRLPAHQGGLKGEDSALLKPNVAVIVYSSPHILPLPPLSPSVLKRGFFLIASGREERH